MTVSGVLQAMGMRDLRTNLRAVVERVEAGTPVVCLKDGQPLAVLLTHEEGERWRKIEDSLATLHAMNVYPEAVNDPRSWVPACGGLNGSSGHHGAMDVARSLRLPFAALPVGTLELADELGLSWWIERSYK